MELAIEFMVGVSFLTLGLSFVFQAGDWNDVMANLKKGGRCGSLGVGTFSLLLGSFIIGFHWIWEGWQILVTVLGMVFMFKGIVYLLFPFWLPAKLAFIMRYNLQRVVQISGLFLIVTSSAILCIWWVQISN